MSRSSSRWFVAFSLLVLFSSATIFAVDPLPPSVRATLTQAIKDASNRRSYLPARLLIREGRALVESLKWGGSSDLIAFMKANALIIVPEDVTEVAAGDEVEVVLLG